MAEPFLGEVRVFSFNFAPKGWAFCNGQLFPINQNQALFSLLGTTFGGDGRVNFALPDLRGITPIHVGNGHGLGERGGEQEHTLSISELPSTGDPEFEGEMTSRVTELLSAIEDLASQTHQAVASGERRDPLEPAGRA